MWAGVNSELNADHLPPHALAECKELYYQTPAILRSRGGFDLFATCTGGGNIKLMYGWYKDANLYVSDDVTSLWKVNSSGTATAVSGPAQTVTSIVSFGVSNAPTLYVVELAASEGHTIHTYDGTTYATLTGTSIPLPQKLMVRHERLLGTAAAAFPSRIYYSKVNDATVWSGAWNEGGFFDVAPGHGGDIIDWVEKDGVLYVFKEAGIWAIRGDDPTRYQVRQIVEARHIRTGTAIDCGGRGILYCSSNGVFPVGRTYEYEANDLSSNIQADVQTILSPGLDTAAVRGGYSPELGAYVLCGQTTTLRVSNSNNRPDVWTTFTTPAAVYSLYQWNKFYLGSTGGKVYEYDHDGWTDDAVAFTPSLKTGYWDMGDPRVTKTLGYIKGDYNSKENAEVHIAPHIDNEMNVRKEYVVPPGENTALPVNYNFSRLQMEIKYKEMSGPVYFTGLDLEVGRVGDEK